MVGGAVLVTLLGEVLGRAAGLGALGANSQAGNRVALTFDDGPSLRTPALLSVLEEVGARATFFVLRDAALRFPAEFQALLTSGHQIEAHGLDHRHALRLWPWQEWAQVRWHPRGAAGLLYRPPYGGHSPLTRLLVRLAGRQIALWDVESRDWTVPRSDLSQAQTLAQATFQQVRLGSVILLHDGPAVTPELLRELLPLLMGRMLKLVTLAELPMCRIGVLDGLRRVKTAYRR